ncbi:MAG: hypothetical protein OQJ89_04120, partial [Kangiellaceae bacterium]|nr:hypothetical protein [Kangiellaceae bacterium]
VRVTGELLQVVEKNNLVTQSEEIGILQADTTYVVEYEILNGVSTVYVYVKGTERTSGFSHSMNVADSDWGDQAGLSFYARPTMPPSDALIFVDNVIFETSGETVTPEPPTAPDTVITFDGTKIDQYSINNLETSTFSVVNERVEIQRIDGSLAETPPYLYVDNRMLPSQIGVARFEFTTEATITDGGFLGGLTNSRDGGDYSHMVMVQGPTLLYFEEHNSPSVGAMGTLQADTTYVVEYDIVDGVSTMYVFEKGSDRASGFSHSMNVSDNDWLAETGLSFFGTPTGQVSGSLVYIDNVEFGTDVVEETPPSPPASSDMLITFDGTDDHLYAINNYQATGSISVVNERVEMRLASSDVGGVYPTLDINESIEISELTTSRFEFTTEALITDGAFDGGLKRGGFSQMVRVKGDQLEVLEYFYGDPYTTSLGSLSDDTTYVVEYDISPTQSTMYVFEKGTDRSAGMSHTKDISSWSGGATLSFTTPYNWDNSNSVVYIDNIEFGPIAVAPQLPSAPDASVQNFQPLPIVFESVPETVAVDGNSISRVSGDLFDTAYLTLTDKFTNGQGEVEFTVSGPESIYVGVKEGTAASSILELNHSFSIGNNNVYVSEEGSEYDFETGVSLPAQAGDTYKITMDGSHVFYQLKRQGGEYEVIYVSTFPVSPTSDYTVNFVLNRVGSTISDISVSGNTGATNEVSENQNTTEAYVSVRSFYDKLGRERFSVDGEGYVKEFVYDSSNNIIETKTWMSKLDVNVTTTQDIENWLAAPVGNSQLPVYMESVNSKFVFDENNQMRYSLDAENYLVEREYDTFGNVISQKTYLNTYNSSVLSLEATKAWADANANFVEELYVYDNRNQMVYSIDGDGYLTEYKYDFAGQVSETLRHSRKLEGLSAPVTAASIEQQLNATEAGGVPLEANYSLTSRNVYDGNGRLIFQIDPEGLVTEYQYDYLNDFVATKKYASLYTSSTATESELQAWTSGQSNLITTRSIYDKSGQLRFSIDGEGGVTEYIYNSLGQLTEKKQYETRIGELSEYSVESLSVALAAEPTAVNTKFVYDNIGQIRFEVDALGFVTENIYDHLGNITQEIKYEDSISASSANLTEAEIISLLEANAPPPGASINFDEYDTADSYTISPADTNDITIEYGQAVFTRTPILTTSGKISVNKVGLPSQYEIINFEFTTEDVITDGGFIAGINNSQIGVSKHNHLISVFDNQIAATSVTAGVNGTAQYGTIQAATTYVVEIETSDTTSTIYVYEKGTDKNAGFIHSISIDDNAWGDQTVVEIAASPYLNSAGGKVYIDNLQVSTAGDLTAEDGPLLRLNKITTNFAYDKVRNLVSTTDASGETESFGYDALGNKTQFVNKLQQEWTYAYDNRGQLEYETSPEVAVYNHETQSTTPENVVKRFTYDAFGNVESITDNYKESTFGTAEARTTSYIYDNRGNQTKIIYSDQGVYSNGQITATGNNAENETKYNAFGLAVVNVDELGNNRYKTYNNNLQVEYEIDGEGHVTFYEYDSFNNVEKVTRYAKSIFEDAANVANELSEKGVALTSNDILGYVVPDTNHDRIISFSYNALDQKISETQEAVDGFNSDIKAAFTAAPKTTYEYNSYGQLVKTAVKIDGSGSTANSYNYYNKLGQLEATFEVKGEINTSTLYGYLTEYEYDAFGNKAKQTEYAEKIEVEYVNFQPSVDENNRPSGTQHDDNRVTRYIYDKMNRLTETIQEDVLVTSHSGNSIVTSAEDVSNKTEYDELGRVTAQIDGEGFRAETEYDNLGRVEKVILSEREVAAKHDSAVNSTLDPFLDSSGLRTSPTTQFYYNAYGELLKTVKSSG